MIEHDAKGGEHDKEDKAEIGKDVVGPRGAVAIVGKGRHEHHVLIRQNDEDSQKEANGKGRGESLQDKGP